MRHVLPRAAILGPNPIPERNEGMKLRPFGRTGVQVSPICLGTMMFGAKTDEPESGRIIDLALARGINFVDTADAYGGNETERIVGRALARDGRRRKIVLATKLYFPQGDDPNARGLSRRHVIGACEASLERLKTDWIDLYQLHRCSADVPDRRDAARPRRSDPRGQGPLYRRQHAAELADGGVALGGEGARAEPLRERAARIQSARPHGGARGDPRRADLRAGRDSVGPPLRRAAHGQIRPRTSSTSRAVGRAARTTSADRRRRSRGT